LRLLEGLDGLSEPLRLAADVSHQLRVLDVQRAEPAAFLDQLVQRHYLVDKDEEDAGRRDGGKIRAAATVFTVKNAAGEKRHFTVAEDGQVVECANYEAGFGELLLRPHETRRFEHQGKWHRTHKFSLCWAGYELYEPKSAEDLAALRATRERKKEERADKKFAEDNPLFTWMGLKREG